MLPGIVIALAVIALATYVVVKNRLVSKTETTVKAEVGKVEADVTTEVKKADQVIIGRLQKL